MAVPLTAIKKEVLIMTDHNAIEKQEGNVARVERTHSGKTYLPQVDILEKDDEMVLLADMPGVTADGIDLDYEQGELTISGRVTPRCDLEKVDLLLQEYGVGDFERRFKLGEGIDPNRITAELNNGVLKVRLGKTAQSIARRIPVQGSD